MTVHRNTAWNELNPEGWYRRDGGSERIATYASAPHSPSNVLEIVYAQGTAGGGSPAMYFTTFPQSNGYRELFIGAFIQFNEGWQGHNSYINKIGYIWTSDNGNTLMTAFGPPSGPFQLDVVWQGRRLNTYRNYAPIIPGQWHRVEWYLRYNSAPSVADGIMRWWVDGVLAAEYTDLTFPANTFFMNYEVSGVWGGTLDSKRNTDYLRFDHSYVSVR